MLRLNHKLISIMMNKGQIYEDLGYFLGVLQIRSNQMTNWSEKLEILVYLEIRLKDKSMESMIAQFGLVFVEKSRSKIEVEKSIVKKENLRKLLKINLI